MTGSTALRPEARALLELFDHVPYSQIRDDTPDRLWVTLRSAQTLAELVAEQGWDVTDPDTRYMFDTQIQAFEADPEGHWEQRWPLTQPSRSGWAADWTVEQWAAYEAGQFPVGFFPIARASLRLDDHTIAAFETELRSGSVMVVRLAAAKLREASAATQQAMAARDDAVRAALASGVPAVDVADAAGVARSRVYQMIRKVQRP